MIAKRPDKGKRRKELRKNRTKKELKTLWRSLIAISILGGLGWIFSLPNWVIRDSSQITITGNEILAENAVRDLISLSYPQSIFRLPIPELDQKLESQPPIVEATFTRQLVPPEIEVAIRERVPVAIVLDSTNVQDAIGFVSPEGIFLPESFYSNVKKGFILPKLICLGFKEENRSDWTQLYKLISNAKINIKQIDWRDVNNLVFATELGKVHLGADRTILSEQLKVLEQMADLPSKVKLQEIDYIDLSNPSNPLVQVFNPKDTK